MATWRVDSYTKAGVLVTSNLPVTLAKATWGMNGDDSIGLDFNLSDLARSDLEVGKHELRVFRDGDGAWGGYAWDAQVDPRGGLTAGTVKIVGNGYGSHLGEGKAVIDDDLIRTSTNQQQIAWDVIAHYQALANGNLGFTQGTHSGSSVARTREYCERDHVVPLNAITELTQHDDGIDWAFSPYPGKTAFKQFDTWSPKRGSASGITLDGSKVDVMPFVETARDMANYVTYLADSSCSPARVDASDATLAATYKRMHHADDAENGEFAEAQSEANEDLRARKRARHDSTIQFREGGTGAPAWGTWGIGSTFTLSDDRGYATYSKTLRIIQASVIWDPKYPTLIEWVTSSAVD